MNSTEKPMSTERMAMLITILTAVTQGGLYLLSGGFAVGGKLSDVTAEIKLLRQEVQASNQIQDYRLDKLDATAK
jgi:hypothetical protein